MQEQAPIHVLVVEDEAVNRDVVCQMLRHFGHLVSAVESGREALAAIQASSYDLVIMDCRMEDLDGLEATRRLRAGAAGEQGRTIPIVALTAQAFAADREACFKAGMNDFLTKPVEVDALMAAVGRWGRCRAEVRAGQRAPLADTAMAASSLSDVFDHTVLAALPMVADGSQPEYGQAVLKLYLESLPKLLASIQQAVHTADTKTAQRVAHSLKSSSAAVGAMAMAACAAQAEAQLRAGQHDMSHLPARFDMELQRLLITLGSQQQNATSESAV